MTRVNVLDVPVAAPGTCILCGSSGDGKRKFIDFGKNIEFHGAVYFCTICIIEVAGASGFVPEEKFKALYTDFRKLRVEAEQIRSKYEMMDNALRSTFGGSYTIPEQRDVSYVEKSEDVVSGNPGSNEGNTETNESTVVEGPDDLFDDSDFDE